MPLQDFTCPHHGTFEAIAPASVDELECPACGATSPWSPTAPAVHTAFVVSATQGKSDPPPSALATNTRPLMEGQRYSEWRKERKKVWREHDFKTRKERG